MTSHNSRTRRKTRPVSPRGTVSFPYSLPDGRRALYVGMEIRDSDPAAVKEGLSRRRLLATQGRCPCGAVVPFDPSLISPGIAQSATAHAADCPAAEETLRTAILRTDRRADR